MDYYSQTISDKYDDFLGAVKMARAEGLKITFYAQVCNQKGLAVEVNTPEIHVENPQPTRHIIRPYRS